MVLGLGDAPNYGYYGQAVVGAGGKIFIATDAGTTNHFFSYDPSTGGWDTTLAAPDQQFRNGTSLAWDQGNYIYALLGGHQSTPDDRRLFYCYDVSSNSWTALTSTPHFQSSGDTLAWVPGSVLGEDSDYLYAILGKGKHNGSVGGVRGSEFYRYSVDDGEWSGPIDFAWDDTDDGASLAWAGDEHLYALRGEEDEVVASWDFARFNLLDNTWENRRTLGDFGLEPGGIADGASLLWAGGDYIYALGGGRTYPEESSDAYDDNFYRYSISGDAWEQLDDLPSPVGEYAGCRLGLANGKIYAWQGMPSTEPSGGDDFWEYPVGLAAPDLISPLNGAIINDSTPTFRWTQPEAFENYTLVIDDSADFSSPVQTITDIADNTYTLTSPLVDGTYYWRVRAIDGAGNESGWSEVWQFAIETPFTITGAHFEPTKFKPSAGQTTTLYYTLTKDAKKVTIKIYDSARNLVETLIKGKPRAAGLNSEIWDGLVDGTPVAPGKYRAKIVAISYEGEKAKASARVTVK